MTTTTDTDAYVIQRAAELRTQAAEADARGEHRLGSIYLACADSWDATLAAREADARGEHDRAAELRQTATNAALRSAQLVEAL